MAFLDEKSKSEKLYRIIFSQKYQNNDKTAKKNDISSKKRTNKFDFTTRRLVFFPFLEESEDIKKTFRNRLTLVQTSLFVRGFWVIQKITSKSALLSFTIL